MLPTTLNQINLNLNITNPLYFSAFVTGHNIGQALLYWEGHGPFLVHNTSLPNEHNDEKPN